MKTATPGKNAPAAGGDSAPNDIVEFLTHLEKERDV